MSEPTTVRSATRRYVALLALHWFPVGLTVPVMVLLMQSRGLSLAQVGLAFSVYGALGVVLELPTGGLADVVGRRPVLLVAALLHALSCGAFFVADGFGGFLVALALMALGRALFSGSLQAWYVDAVHALEPGADLARGLSRGEAADAGSLAVAAAVGGALPALLGGSLAAPFAVAAGLDVLFAVAVLRLVSEVRPPREGSLRSAVADGARAVPRTVAGSVRLSMTDRPLRLVLVLAAVSGAGLTVFELLGPVRFTELAGSPERGAAVFGTVSALGFAAAAAGALAAPALRRAVRGSSRLACALLAVLAGGALAGFAGASAVVAAGAAVVVYYLAHAGQWPLMSTVLHSRVSREQRATAVSAASLAVALGAVAAGLGLPLLARATSPQGAAVAVAVLFLLSVALCLRLPNPTAGSHEEALLDQPLDDGQHLLGGLGVGQPGAGGQHAEQLTEPPAAVAGREQRGAVVVDPAGPAQS